MRLPRLILNPSIRPWVMLLQRERKENIRLRRELTEWQNKFLMLKGATPLFTVPKPPEQVERPPIGPTAKKLALAQRQGENPVPTAEQILGDAARANGGR